MEQAKVYSLYNVYFICHHFKNTRDNSSDYSIIKYCYLKFVFCVYIYIFCPVLYSLCFILCVHEPIHLGCSLTSYNVMPYDTCRAESTQLTLVREEGFSSSCSIPCHSVHP